MNTLCKEESKKDYINQYKSTAINCYYEMIVSKCTHEDQPAIRNPPQNILNQDECVCHCSFISNLTFMMIPSDVINLIYKQDSNTIIDCIDDSYDYISPLVGRKEMMIDDIKEMNIYIEQSSYINKQYNIYQYRYIKDYGFVLQTLSKKLYTTMYNKIHDELNNTSIPIYNSIVAERYYNNMYNNIIYTSILYGMYSDIVVHLSIYNKLSHLYPSSYDIDIEDVYSEHRDVCECIMYTLYSIDINNNICDIVSCYSFIITHMYVCITDQSELNRMIVYFSRLIYAYSKYYGIPMSSLHHIRTALNTFVYRMDHVKGDDNILVLLDLNGKDDAYYEHIVIEFRRRYKDHLNMGDGQGGYKRDIKKREVWNGLKDDMGYDLDHDSLQIFPSTFDYMRRILKKNFRLRYVFDRYEYSADKVRSEIHKTDDSLHSIYNGSLYTKCEICGRVGEIMKCLICGVFMCKSQCGIDKGTTAVDDKGKKIYKYGNGVKHTFANHTGRCILLDCSQGHIYLYDTKKVWIYKEVYIGPFGKIFDIESDAYGMIHQHTLDRDVYNTIVDAYACNKLRSLIASEVKKKNFMVHDGYI